LGVNATGAGTPTMMNSFRVFQWAPTLGGECYVHTGVGVVDFDRAQVSMGTHPWG